MRRPWNAAVVLAAAAVAAGLSVAPAQAAPLVAVTAATGEVIEGEYIVRTRPGAARTVADARTDRTMYVYDTAVHGFAAKLDARELRALQRDPDVVAIEHNQVVHANASQSPTPNWGLDRIDQRNLPLNNTFTYFNDGTGVTAYIIDTGILPSHPAFGGKASVGTDLIGGNGIDCNGHGTHMASTIGATVYGVAKNIRLVGVRVLNCTGSGSFATVIAGVNWVQANSPGPSVALMALGGAANPSVDTAVNNLAASGVFVGVSGGSGATDACTVSPARASGAYAVIRTTNTDQSPASNNWGSCIDMQAPGTNIPGAWLNNTVQVISGTSSAAAHAVGVAAMFKDAVGDVPSSVVASWLNGVATAGVLTGVHPQSPNLLLHTNGI
ncbi:MAG TPA: S8 family peptidase [Pseudonocardiaceae bacterium]